jgi:predicted  nucleic acid-binding Zn-ribbon protein
MNALLENLLKLQSLELANAPRKNTGKQIAELRGKIPAAILYHYERLVARGKKGVALVENQVCTGCHMRLPLGVIMTLSHGDEIQACDSCGRYLYLPETESPVQPTLLKTAAKARQPRTSHAA